MKAFLLVISLGLCQGAWAFSDLGHKLVASAAWEQLTPKAKQHIEAILGQGKSKFVKASIWADHIKGNSDFDHLKPLHYVNLPKDQRVYNQQRDCPENKCVVEAINDYTKKVKTGSDSEKLLAIRMLIHLLGDIHQPLHAGLFEDRGGNGYKIKYKNKSLSMHKFWDNHAVKRFEKGLTTGTKRILAMDKKLVLGTPEKWAEESHGIVLDFVYQAKKKEELSESYLLQTDVIMENQLNKGSWRLAQWLNGLW